MTRLSSSKRRTIAAAHLQCGGGDVDRIHPRARERPWRRPARSRRSRCRCPGSGVRGARRPRARKRCSDEFGDRRARHQHALIDVQLEAGEERSMREIGERHALGDAPLAAAASMRAARRARQRLGVGAGAQRVREPRRKEHQFGRLVARIVGAVTEVHARARAAPARSARWRRRRSRARRAVWDNRRMTPRSKFLSFALICIAGIAGIAAALLWRHPRPPVELTTGTYLAPARALPDFSLIDSQGRQLWARQSARPLVADVLRLYELPGFLPDHAHDTGGPGKAPAGGQGAVLPQVIFVSVDAKRDTPAQLAKYVPYFDPEFIGLTAADQPAIEARRAKARRRRDHPARSRRQLHRRSFRRDLRARSRRQARRDPDRTVHASMPCRRLSSASWPRRA